MSEDQRDTTELFRQELLPAIQSFMAICRVKGRGDDAQRAIEGQELMKIAVCVAVRQVWEGYRMMGGRVSYADFTREFFANIQKSIEEHMRNQAVIDSLLKVEYE